MELWVGAVNLGLLYAIMTMGVFITFRIHDFPDITVDGSFTAGAAAAAVLMAAGVNPVIALGAAFLIGIAAGWITAFIHTKFHVNGLLAGILVMTALYSINLHIMGRSNIPLLNQKTLFSWLAGINPGLHPEIWTALALSVLMTGFWLLMSLFFKTDFGIAMRVTGNNPTMAAANGINVAKMTIFGVALANGFVAVSGALVAQYQGFADIGMGIGTVVIGLAAVIIGESVLRINSMFARVLSVIIGAIIFRLMIAFALYVGMNPIDLKLLTAVFVFVTLVFSKSVSGAKSPAFISQRIKNIFAKKKLLWSFCLILVTAAFIIPGYHFFTSKTASSRKHFTIGCVQLTDNGLLNITRDSLIEELNRLGYRNGEDCTIFIENAGGDLPTVSTILDKFLRENVDVIVTISTGCTQVAINKVKDKPIVFATVANPFIIKAGTSDADHLPNVTGVYGWVPMDRTLEIVRKFLPGSITIGAIWDPAQANSVFNVELLQKAAKAYSDVKFKGATITNSSEVYSAAVSLVQKGISAFVLSPDNIVYSAFESVVKAAQARNIPIFLSDVERLRDGALAVLGYDYTISGVQAAGIVDRILKGARPRDIPFERYKKLTLGINLDTAKRLGLNIPPDVRSQANMFVGMGTDSSGDKSEGGIIPGPPKRLALFLFSDHNLIIETAHGVVDELESSGILKKYNVTIDTKNAQNEFYIAQSVAQDIVAQKYDYIISLTTPALQAMANMNKKIPHIFGAVTDPYRAGVAKTPTDHLPHITGVATIEPVDATIKYMRELFPAAKKLGIVWNPGEACSETCTYIARESAKKYGFELLEANVSATSEVMDALKSLLAKKIDLFLTSGDNTVIMSLEATAGVLRQYKIPYFSNAASDVQRGTFVSVGPDYYLVGIKIAQTAARVISGEQPKDIPIESFAPDVIYLNLDLAREYGIKIPEASLKKAAQVLVNGKLASPEESTPVTPSAARAKRLALFAFSENILLTETCRGIMEELENSDILTRYNITIDQKNAQNEFSLAQAIAQDIVRQNYDYIITASTPALQVMANANKKIPHVFGAVTDPYRMGVAKTSTDHLPNVTGVATFQPVSTAIKLMRDIFPQAKTIGLIWNPAEACSEACTYKARDAAKKYGFELLETTVSGTGEVMDALKSILNKKPDIFLTSGDNTVVLALDAIAMTLRQNKIPYFTNAPADIDRGVFLGVGADYIEVGRATAKMAIRVIKGENIKDIPINDYVPEKMNINLALAREYGIIIPPDILGKATRLE
jgi:putative tryptophan/tyrosine transport system permease protein